MKPVLECELLEGRVVPATITVNSTLDNTINDNAVTLREALLSIRNGDDLNIGVAIQRTGVYGTADQIDFNLPEPRIITLLSNLPELTKPVYINGYSQPLAARNSSYNGFNGNVRVAIKPATVAGAPAADYAFFVKANNCTISGLAIWGFKGTLPGAIDEQYEDLLRPGGTPRAGIISYKNQGFFCSGNIFGFDSTMTMTNVGNSINVWLFGCDYFKIGDTVLDKNVISRADDIGLLIANCASSSWTYDTQPWNKVQLNDIGTDLSGNAPYANGVVTSEGGVKVESSSYISVNDNVISGNTGQGISIATGGGEVAWGKKVTLTNNGIGVNRNGTVKIANSKNGVLIGMSTDFTTIYSNTISGNDESGVLIDGNSKNITLTGNRIGTQGDGLLPMANKFGIKCIGMGSGPDNLKIGNATAGNIISANTKDGIYMEYCTDIVITNNLIGLGGDGIKELGNENGIVMNQVSCSNEVVSNFISSNRKNGIIMRATSNGNAVTGNRIGLTQDGVTRRANMEHGIWIYESSANVIGGISDSAAANYISGNELANIKIERDSRFNVVIGNKIGININGQPITNPGYGVFITHVDGIRPMQNQVGQAPIWSIGLIPVPTFYGNVIRGHNKDGVLDNTGMSNTVFFNNISNNVLNGIKFVGESGPDNWPTYPLIAGNVISANGIDGINIESSNCMIVDHNDISTSGRDGLRIEASNYVYFSQNTVYQNVGNGVNVLSGIGNVMASDSIHHNGGLGIDLGNDGPTGNDNLDPDYGANNLQNFPIITSVLVDSYGVMTVSGFMNSTVWSGFAFGIYANYPDSAEEAHFLIGTGAVPTDDAGNGGWIAMIIIPAMPPELYGSGYLTVMATGAGASGPQNSSELSPPVPIPAKPTGGSTGGGTGGGGTGGGGMGLGATFHNNPSISDRNALVLNILLSDDTSESNTIPLADPSARLGQLPSVSQNGDASLALSFDQPLLIDEFVVGKASLLIQEQTEALMAAWAVSLRLDGMLYPSHRLA